MSRQHYKIMTLFLMTFAILNVECSEDDSSVGTTDGKNPMMTCDKMSTESEAYKKCTVLVQALRKLNEALKSISKDEKSDNVDDKKLQQEMYQATITKLVKLRDNLNKLNMNQGYSGLTENFRIFGYPMSKLWALFVLLDPFEL